MSISFNVPLNFLSKYTNCYLVPLSMFFSNIITMSLQLSPSPDIPLSSKQKAADFVDSDYFYAYFSSNIGG